MCKKSRQCHYCYSLFYNLLTIVSIRLLAGHIDLCTMHSDCRSVSCPKGKATNRRTMYYYIIPLTTHNISVNDIPLSALTSSQRHQVNYLTASQ